MAIKKNIQECFPIIDDALNDEFGPLSGCDPIWIANWLTGYKYIMKPKKRIVVSPNTKEELIEWANSDAFSSNCASLERYMNGEASEEEMLKYAKEIIQGIEYEEDPEGLSAILHAAKWNLNKIELVIKEINI